MLPVIDVLTNGFNTVMEMVTEGQPDDVVNSTIGDVVDEVIGINPDMSADDLMTLFLKLNIQDPTNNVATYDELYKKSMMLRDYFELLAHETNKTRKLLESHLLYLEGQMEKVAAEIVENQREMMEIIQVIMDAQNKAMETLLNFLTEYSNKVNAQPH